MNKTVLKKILLLLYFWRKLLIWAARFHLATVIFFKMPVPHGLIDFIRRLSHFKIIPESSSN